MPKILQPEERKVWVNARLTPKVLGILESVSQDYTKGNRTLAIEKLLAYFADNPEAIAEALAK